MEVIRHEVKGVVGGAALSAKTMQQLAPGVLQEIMEGDRSGRNILHKHNSFLRIFFSISFIFAKYSPKNRWRELVRGVRQEVASCSREVADTIRYVNLPL